MYNHKLNRKIRTLVIPAVILTVVLITNSVVFMGSVSATRGPSTTNTQINIDDSIDIKDINISVFKGLDALPGEYATIFSWLSFAGTVFSVGLIIFWIFLLIRASFIAAKSEGDESGLGEAQKRVKSTFVGAAVSILIPAIISLVGVFLGLGPLWLWPTAFRDCPNSPTGNQFYFQEVLEFSNGTWPNPRGAAEASCYP